MLKAIDGFGSFSVDDLAKAKEFYGGVLGLKVEEDEMGILNISLPGGCTVIAYPKPNHAPATFTVLNLVVNDIEQTVDDLTSRGVEFQHYDMPDIKTDAKGIASGGGGPMIAWFTDPAGNIVSIIEQA
jgi:predicted enzyme related to lactoylglutathione lyase